MCGISTSLSETLSKRVWLGLFLVGLNLLLLPGGAKAATLTVTNTNDSGAGSLRQTILNSTSGDTINFTNNLSGCNHHADQWSVDAE